MMLGLIFCRLSLPRHCARSPSSRYMQDGFSVLQFFKSTVACEFVVICKDVNRFWCCLVYLIQKNYRTINSWLPSALMTRIFTHFLFDFSQVMIVIIKQAKPQLEQIYLDSVKSILKQMNIKYDSLKQRWTTFLGQGPQHIILSAIVGRRQNYELNFRKSSIK